MKKILFLLAVMPMMFACSSSENEEEKPINISLDKNKLSVSVGKDVDLGVNGVNIWDCDIEMWDEHIATFYKRDDGVNITAEHVGKTFLNVSFNGATEQCEIEVTPILKNLTGNPILEFGITKDDLKKRTNGSVKSEGENNIEIECKENRTYYHDYHFKKGALECIMTHTFSDEYITDVALCLLEYYEKLSYSTKQYWFEYPDKMVILLRKKSGNGGYQIIYAKDQNTMAKYYQI